MKVRKVALHELDEFIRSEEYIQLDTKPITPKRAASYLRNPTAKPNDFVLYFLAKGTKLLAFRSLLADRLNGEKEPFAWLSGNWVHPDYRRQGISQQLLDEAINDWNGRLMLSNYSPAAEQLIIKTKQFHSFYQADGERFYLFTKTSKILKDRYKTIAFLLPIVDFFIFKWASAKSKIYKPDAADSYSAELLESPDPECFDLVKSSKKKLFFRRGVKSLKWILKYPWLSTNDKRYIKNYPFSSYASAFKYITLKVFKEDRFAGFLIYSIRDGHLKTLLFFGENSILPFVANQLCTIAVKEKVEMMTVLDSNLSEVIKSVKHPFVYHKKIDHKIYSSFSPKKTEGKIQSADGDFIFS
ncbi:GNAT family N-acetyltransferase [Sunxiuqinia sp. A32]|uniref:GNAT family N-acetyltransferase n=1 Tax=Sunxiuqinia sp. A32 TaxID=3461496 RepID=UPI004045B517